MTKYVRLIAEYGQFLCRFIWDFIWPFLCAAPPARWMSWGLVARGLLRGVYVHNALPSGEIGLLRSVMRCMEPIGWVAPLFLAFYPIGHVNMRFSVVYTHYIP